MKKLLIIVALIVVVLVYACSRKTTPAKTIEPIPAIKKIASVTYGGSIKVLIEAKCVPCHVPAKGGFKTPFDNYAAAKKNIDEMIRRIQLAPTEKDYMPFKFKPLTTEEINVFKKWREEGLAE